MEFIILELCINLYILKYLDKNNVTKLWFILKKRYFWYKKHINNNISNFDSKKFYKKIKKIHFSKYLNIFIIKLNIKKTIGWNGQS